MGLNMHHQTVHRIRVLFHKGRQWSKSLLRKNLFHSWAQTLLSLIIGASAIWIAYNGTKDSNEQFNKNTMHADSLFNTQLKNAKNLNDSLIIQIRDLQGITNKQVILTNQQLKVAKIEFQAQLYTERPLIQIAALQMKDTIFLSQDYFRPIFSTYVSNLGKRTAYNSIFREFVVLPDFSETIISPDSAQFFLTPGDIKQSFSSPLIPFRFKDDFYLCSEFEWYDQILKKNFIQVYYHHYYKDASTKKLNFYLCNENEIQNKIRVTINKRLNFLKIPSLKKE
jgi:hypothetical protein